MSHNSCENWHEQIALLAIGELHPDDAAELLSHLETCPECKSLYKEMLEAEVFVQATFAKISSTIRSSQADRQQIDQVVPSPRPATGATRRSQGPRWKWTPAKVLALAAVFVLAATGLFSRLPLVKPSFGATFADVLQRMHKSRSVTYKRIVQAEGQEPIASQEMALELGRLRTVLPKGELFIRDYANGREVRIDPVRKVARLTHTIRNDRERLARYLDWVATLHEGDGVLVGRQDLEGRKTNVFRINEPFEETTVWADVQTDLPVRIERILSPCLGKDIKVPDLFLCADDFRNTPGATVSSSGYTGSSGDHRRLYVKGPGVREEKTTVTLTDFVWDVALDESQFEVTAPAGYQVIEASIGEAPKGEEALIACLRFWAETSDRTFPADINMLQEARPKLIKKFDKDRPAMEEYAEALKMARVVVNGMLFAQTLKAVDNWHYAGKDVREGEANKPLCWWKNKHGDTYRVVFGDLTVRNVSPVEMPSMGETAG